MRWEYESIPKVLGTDALKRGPVIPLLGLRKNEIAHAASYTASN
jgi:hypothetical protein